MDTQVLLGLPRFLRSLVLGEDFEERIELLVGEFSTRLIARFSQLLVDIKAQRVFGFFQPSLQNRLQRVLLCLLGS